MRRELRSPQARISRAWEGDDASSPTAERFFGFGVMGQPFSSGHVLALRCFPRSSIGPGYTAVWHRDPSGAWRFYADAPPHVSCARYFGAALLAAEEHRIEVRWRTPWHLDVGVPGVGLTWQLQLTERPTTRAMNAISAWIPEPWWWHPRVQSVVEALARRVLHLGEVKLAGRAPNGQRYIATPRTLWVVGHSTATWRGQSLGTPQPLSPQARLGEFWLPQRGVLAIGAARFDRFDPARHMDPEAAGCRWATPGVA